jgi:hypothetical protein
MPNETILVVDDEEANLVPRDIIMPKKNGKEVRQQ